LLNENLATLEKTVTEQAKKERATSEAVEKKSTMLTVQVLWGCHAFNATPEDAARQVVADLYEQLSRGGTVTVHIEDADGKEHTLEVSLRD
jgi:predicted methyltransferase